MTPDAPLLASQVIVRACLLLVAAIALYRQEAWALAYWPWPIRRVSAIFLSSIFAAPGVPPGPSLLERKNAVKDMTV